MKSSLNHIYRSIWSEVLNAWVAVSELTSAKGKRSGSSVLNAVLTASAINATQPANREWGIKRAALALALCFTFHAAQANPLGAQVVNGTAAINQIGNTLTVTNSPNAIINWQSFSINSGETTRFVQQSASSAVLNRVVGADPSQLLGTLTSNGKVFLINPAGILVGQGARIDVAGLVASTLNLSNEDFLAGKLNFGPTFGAGGVQNFGAITTPEGGTVYLVAPEVDNQGIITTPKGETILAAGNTVQLLDTGTPGVTVQVTGADNMATNVGQILADSGRIGMVGAVVRNSGTVSASSLVSEGGRVFLKASKDVYVEKNARIEASGTQGGSIEVLGNRVAVTDNATLDASGQNGGGTVLVGGDYQGKNPDIQNAAITYFGTNASIKADAWNNGNGGKVILWADDTTRAYGSISVRGGAVGGNGGFVETSGHRYLDVTRAPDLAAPQGKAGAWLLDPEDITISSSASSNNAGTTTFTPAAAGSSMLNDTVLRNALVNGGTVTVDTTGGGAGTGNILVDGSAGLTSMVLTGPAVLNLKAHNDITINSSIAATGAMSLAMNLIADQDSNGLGAININNQIITNNGNFVATAAGDISFLVPSGQNIIDTGTGTASLTSTLGRLGYGVGYSNQFYVMGSGVTLSAKSGIGGGGSSFHTRVGSIAFSNSTSGNVDIYNDALSASSFFGTNNGGQVLLQSYYQTAPTTIGAITAAGDVLFRMNNIDVTGPVNAGANTVYAAPYTFNAPASINGSAQFDLTGAEISNISADKIVVGYDTFGNYASDITIGTLAPVNITNAANLGVVAPSITVGAANFTNTNGSLLLQTDSLVFGVGTINTGATGNVMISGKNETQINLGGADTAGTLGLSAAGLGNITAGKLTIGDMNTNSMVVSSPISPTATTLSLTSGVGGISGVGSLAVTNLAIRSVGSVDLGTSYSSVSNVAASVGDFITPNNPNFKLKNTPTLNVGAGIDGLSGIGISIDGAGYNPSTPNGVIALTSINGLTQSAGALLAGKAVYAEGGRVNLTEVNPTGVISGKAMGNAAGDVFNYTSSNGIAVTTVNGFSGIQAASVTDPMGIWLSAGSAGISQDAGASIITGRGLMLSTTGPVNLGSAVNNVFALGTVVSTGQFTFNNNGALTVGVSGNGISTTNQSVKIRANGLLTVVDGIGGASSIALEADNISFAGGATLTATNEIGFKPYTDNRSITIGSACNGADPSCLLLDAAFLSSANVNAPDLVIGNEIVADTNTAGNIHVDAAINHTGRIALVTGGYIDQAAVITATGLGIIAGGTVALNANNMITDLAGTSGSGSFSFKNGQSLNVVTMTGGLGPNTTTLTGITSSASGDAVVLAAGGNFINNAGAGGISTPNGRWLVYSTNPANNTFGGLNSNNTAVWNTTIAGTPPASVSQAGNRYLFSYQPTVTFTSVSSSKTYGTDATTAVASSFSVSGLNAGVANAYLADSNATAFSGAPSVISSGSGGTAAVAGSPYAINVSQGGLSALNGYALGYASTGLLTVNPAALTVTANNAAKTYGATKTYAGTEFTQVGLVNSETIGSVTLSSTGDASTASVLGGPYAINASAATGGSFTASNYTISYTNGALTVNPAALTVTASNAAKTYGATKTYLGTEFTQVGLVNSETIGSVTLSGSGDVATASVLGGPYAISASAATGGTFTASNYTISYTNGALTVNPAALTVTANNAAKTYGVTQTYVGTEFTPAGLVNSETIGSVTLSSTGDAANASVLGGPYAISASAASGGTFTASNYTISYTNGVLTVNPASLTVAANPFTKTYDGVAYSGGNGVAYTGLVNGETSAVLGGALAYSGSSQGAINAGSYLIAPNGLTSGNYTISYTSGALTVDPAALTVTASNAAKTYGATKTYAGTEFTQVGLVNSETIGSVTLSSSGDVATASVLGGPYAISASAATGGTFTASNYTISYANGALTVNPAALTVTASNAAKTYGVTKTYLGTEFTQVGLVNSETIGSVTLSSSGDIATAGVLGGPYTISASAATGGTFTASNYTTSYTNGVLTVNPAALTVAANGYTKEYDGLAYSGGNGVIYSGLMNGETSAVLGGTLVYGGSSQGAIDLGSYLITPGGLTSSNYTIGFVDGGLTIAPPITPATTEAVQTVAMVTTTTTSSATTTATGEQTAPVTLDPNAIVSSDPTSSASGSATGTLDSSGGEVGGTAGTFGGEQTTSTAGSEGVAQEGGTDAEGSAKKDDQAKKDDAEKKDDTAKKDEGNAKDDPGNKDKKNAKPEKC